MPSGDPELDASTRAGSLVRSASTWALTEEDI